MTHIRSLAERDRIIALLRNSDEFLEQWSRATAPKIWANIDESIKDDDWNGGTALNLRRTILRDDRKALEALAEVLCRREFSL